MALKRVRYVGRYPEVELQNTVGDWVTVEQGGTIDVSTSLAESLLEQTDNWAPATRATEKGDD